jgi:hypothetical protein
MKFLTGAAITVTKFPADQSEAGRLSETLREWVIIVLTFAFIVLYGLALIGKLRPLADLSIVSRLEPIIFVIIGYYFGRLPGQQNELTLKQEIERQTKIADAAQDAKETALQSREALDQKVKNARTALASSRLVYEGRAKAVNHSAAADLPHGSIAAAFDILKT